MLICLTTMCIVFLFCKYNISKYAFRLTMFSTMYCIYFLQNPFSKYACRLAVLLSFLHPRVSHHSSHLLPVTNIYVTLQCILSMPIYPPPHHVQHHPHQHTFDHYPCLLLLPIIIILIIIITFIIIIIIIIIVVMILIMMMVILYRYSAGFCTNSRAASAFAGEFGFGLSSKDWMLI